MELNRNLNMENCKYYKEERLVSDDNGVTWYPTGEYRQGDAIGCDSSDCDLYKDQYLTFVSISSDVRHKYDYSVKYSLDDGATWTQLGGGSYSPVIHSGEKIMWKEPSFPNSSYTGSFSSSGGTFKAEGSCKKSGFKYRRLFSGNTRLSNAEDLYMVNNVLGSDGKTDYMCEEMFMNCTALKTPPNLLKLGTNGYSNCGNPRQTFKNMFSGCKSLREVPKFNSYIVWGNECCYGMFSGCTSLTTVPLNYLATALIHWAGSNPCEYLKYCYAYMFADCINLVQAPELLSEETSSNAYEGMFKGCTSLHKVVCLGRWFFAPSYKVTNNWLSGCSSSGTVVINCNTTSWTSGPSGVPEGWDYTCTYSAAQKTEGGVTYSTFDYQNWTAS